MRHMKEDYIHHHNSLINKLYKQCWNNEYMKTSYKELRNKDLTVYTIITVCTQLLLLRKESKKLNKIQACIADSNPRPLRDRYSVLTNSS